MSHAFSNDPISQISISGFHIHVTYPLQEIYLILTGAAINQKKWCLNIHKVDTLQTESCNRAQLHRHGNAKLICLVTWANIIDDAVPPLWFEL